MNDSKIRPWRVLDSRVTYEDRWIRLRSDSCVTGDGAVIEPYHIIEYPDWVNVVPLTRDGALILAREYRHGAGKVVTGLVSGIIDPADPSTEAAARRELREETGYGGGRFCQVLACAADAAHQVNTVTSFLAIGVEPVAAQSFDPGGGEAIEIVLDDLPAVLRRLGRGELRMQATHIAALWSAAGAILAGIAPELAQARDRLRAAVAPA